MAVIELSTRPDPSQVRWFGTLWMPGFLLLVAGVALVRWHAPTLSCVLIVSAFASEVASWLAPGLVRALLVFAHVLTWPIAWVTNHVVLALIYFGLIAPAGLLLRALGRNRTSLIDATCSSYWIARDPPGSVDRYFRPY